MENKTQNGILYERILNIKNRYLSYIDDDLASDLFMSFYKNRKTNEEVKDGYIRRRLKGLYINQENANRGTKKYVSNFNTFEDDFVNNKLQETQEDDLEIVIDVDFITQDMNNSCKQTVYELYNYFIENDTDLSLKQICESKGLDYGRVRQNIHKIRKDFGYKLVQLKELNEVGLGGLQNKLF